MLKVICNMKYSRNKLTQKSIFALLSSVLVSTCLAENVDIFVMAGQSNMQGLKSDGANYPVSNLDNRIGFMWNTPYTSDSGGQWVKMTRQKGRFSEGHFGPEVTFGRCLATSGYRPWIIKYSFANSSIAERWKGPGEGGLYDDMKTMALSAMDIVANAGYTPRVRGFIWIQGESDARLIQYSEKYAASLEGILADFRGNVARNNLLPVLLSVDEQNPSVQSDQIVLYAQKKIASEQEATRFSSMIGLEKADLTHLTSTGVINQGQRLCGDFIQLDACLSSGDKSGKCANPSAPVLDPKISELLNSRQMAARKRPAASPATLPFSSAPPSSASPSPSSLDAGDEESGRNENWAGRPTFSPGNGGVNSRSNPGGKSTQGIGVLGKQSDGVKVAKPGGTGIDQKQPKNTQQKNKAANTDKPEVQKKITILFAY